MTESHKSGRESDPAAVIGRWVGKRGPAKGQPTETREWVYTQADYDADIAMTGDPGTPSDVIVPMAPPHNLFTRRAWDAQYWAHMQPNPGTTNWVWLEWEWTA
jgi:hypothetical protein